MTVGTGPTVRRSIVVGTGPGADLVIEDEYVSPRHCRITEVTGGFEIEDLGSTNGTWLIGTGGMNGGARRERIRVYGPRKIPTGYRVVVGRTQLPWEAGPVSRRPATTS